MLEQMNRIEGQNGQSEIDEDLFTSTVKNLDGCEERIQKMQSCEKLHGVSQEALKEINHIIDSEMSDELKSKALTVVHKIVDNATAFERFAGIGRLTKPLIAN